jgi:DNA-binding MarR family transcriptional regulator
MPDVDLTPNQRTLLAFLYQRPRNGTAFTVALKRSGVSPSAVRQVADALEDLGLIEDREPRLPARRRNIVQLTEAGRQQAAEIHRERRDPVFRRAACRRQLLIYADRFPNPSRWPRVQAFVDAPDFGVHGTPFTRAEAHQAAVYLSTEQLLEYRPSTGEDDSFKITHLGMRCVDDFGGDVSEWRKQQMTSAGNYTIHLGAGSSANTVIGTGNTVTQTATSTTANEESAKWVSDLLQILPLLQLPRDQAAEVKDAAAQLHAEIVTPAPAQSRVRELGRAVLDSVTRALPDAAIAQAPIIAAGILDAGRGLFG